MSDEETQEPDAPGAVFKPLKRTTTRTESVEVGGEAQSPERTFEPLKISSTRTESVSPMDATPLVVVDDEDDVDEDDARTIPELLGELRSLTSRNMILRTERTSIAGRKYALEVVIETLREKLEAVAELCDRLDAPGELGEALKEIKEIVGDARRIADSKAVLEADLEVERAKHLQERQDFEQKTFELNQEMTGVRSERDTLRGQVARLERERISLQQQIDDEKRSVGEVETQAVEQLESYMEQIQQLEAQLAEGEEKLADAIAAQESLQTARDEAVDALEEAVQHSESVTGRVDDLESQLAELQERTNRAEEERDETEQRLADREAEHQAATGRFSKVLIELEGTQTDLDAANARAETQEARASAAEDRRAHAEVERDALKLRLDELEAKVGRQKTTLGEQRKALIEMKPILEDWTKLEKENNRLSRLVGEARQRGRVNIQELMARAALLKRLEKLTTMDLED